MLRIAVITLSDRAFRGEYEDLSGKALLQILREQFPQACIEYSLIADDAQALKNSFQQYAGFNYIFTSGGTGVGPRDITPEVTAACCQREIPGISEYLRLESLKETKTAVFSRAYAGLMGETIIINLPGSLKGATFCLQLLLPLLEHGVAMVRGEGH